MSKDTKIKWKNLTPDRDEQHRMEINDCQIKADIEQYHMQETLADLIDICMNADGDPCYAVVDAKMKTWQEHRSKRKMYLDQKLRAEEDHDVWQLEEENMKLKEEIKRLKKRS